MDPIRRCLVHCHRPERVVDLSKDLVARGAEIMAASGTAKALADAGVPVSELASFADGASAPFDALQLLHPRLMGGLLGQWDDGVQREELERQGVKRIDMVVVELSEIDGCTLLTSDTDVMRDVVGAAILRAAAHNPRWVVSICDPADFGPVQAALDDSSERTDEALRLRLARKALRVLARYDATLASPSTDELAVPDAWSLMAERIEAVPMVEASGRAVGLFGDRADSRARSQLNVLSGAALAPDVLVDADLAWTCVEGWGRPVVALSHHAGLCGFSLGEDGNLHEAFTRARKSDPRGAFGAVVAFNREVDSAAALVLSAGFMQAVVAPGFSAEARAELGRGKTRLLVVEGSGNQGLSCTSTRWGYLLRWTGSNGAGTEKPRTLSEREPEPGELQGLNLAWRLVSLLPSVAVVLADPGQMLAAGASQTNWRDAARLAVMKMPAGNTGVVAACGTPIRFAEDVSVLAEAGITAILCPDGSPRQNEVTERVDALGLALQIARGLV